jgi:hypothetical protein
MDCKLVYQGKRKAFEGDGELVDLVALFGRRLVRDAVILFFFFAISSFFGHLRT